MKKGLLITSILIILLVAVLGSYVLNQRYTLAIERNWSIQLPRSYDELYVIDSGQSFLGDGERFHVFEYRDNHDVIAALSWENGPNTDIEDSISKILKSLGASATFTPDFKSEYLYSTHVRSDGYSTLYLVFFESTHRLYLIESIF
jgi:hypothetical protein